MHRYNREEVVRSLGKEVNLNPPLTLGQLPDTPEELLKLDQVSNPVVCCPLSSVPLLFMGWPVATFAKHRRQGNGSISLLRERDILAILCA